MRPFHHIRRNLTWGVVILFFTHLVSSDIYVSIINETNHADDFTVPQNLLEAYNWLNEHTENNSVVMSPALETNIELAVYSHNKIFLARAQNSLAPEEELLGRLYFTYAFLRIPAEKLYSVLVSPDGVIYFFSLRYENNALDTYLRPEKYAHLKLPKEVLEKALNKFIFYHVPCNPPYRMDYIFIGPRERAMNIDESVLAVYQKLYEKGGVAIYKSGTN